MGHILKPVHSVGRKWLELVSHRSATSGPGSQYSIVQLTSAIGDQGLASWPPLPLSQYAGAPPAGLCGERDGCGDNPALCGVIGDAMLGGIRSVAGLCAGEGLAAWGGWIASSI